MLGLCVDHGTSGVAESHEACELVKGFACGVVDRRAEGLIVAPTSNQDNLAVSTRCEQDDGRRFIGREFESRGIEVTLHVIDPVERLVQRPCQRLAEGIAHHERTDQPRTCLLYTSDAADDLTR